MQKLVKATCKSYKRLLQILCVVLCVSLCIFAFFHRCINYPHSIDEYLKNFLLRKIFF